jgi:hypothetical protein
LAARGGRGGIAPERRFFLDRMIRGDLEASKPPGRDEKMRCFAEKRSPKSKNCGFDVTEPEKLTLTWHIKKKPLF